MVLILGMLMIIWLRRRKWSANERIARVDQLEDDAKWCVSEVLF